MKMDTQAPQTRAVAAEAAQTTKQIGRMVNLLAAPGAQELLS
jgi:hypothetical protein